MGRIHSIESMGLVDGPGIRVVIFFQGCGLRCAFCHNPDTWKSEGGTEIAAEELLRRVLRFKTYFDRSGGGVTCSGGEPLMQPQFLIEFFKLCKENGIHTTLDTAGFGVGKYDEILKYTDLVILDIKHITKDGYRSFVNGDINEFYNFVNAVNLSNARFWVRHVMVPGVTDSFEAMDKLIDIIKRKFDTSKLDKFEILPYHTMGVEKYKKLGINYRLEGIDSMDKNKASEFEKYVREKIKD
ncbi:pyruvate formate-lyase-activating protein [Clostridium oryzae]|uniref:Pyruvate formate-lyase-activating enzyme n=1 Tax=Clostridium oryzae TaxID=1450648 RepID=A0A1V4I874_9CLOT|nr:pyruvate formate-lyase-activating protein [Clostridium oryzae]OPJ55747.1 pyruvate formate-lyase 1-activating enzyme [Clostridium oryzae]